MGIFSKFLKGKDSERKDADLSFIAEIAAAVAPDDARLMSRVESCISDTEEYVKSLSERYEERGIDVCDCDRETLCWIGMTDELCEGGYLSGVDYNCEPGDFLWALEQINGYSLIGDAISALELDEDEDVCAWAEKINSISDIEAHICYVDIDSDSYELIIVKPEVYEKISSLARSGGHKIEKL